MGGVINPYYNGKHLNKLFKPCKLILLNRFMVPRLQHNNKFMGLVLVDRQW